MNNANANSTNAKTTPHKIMSTSAALYLTAGVAPGIYDLTLPMAEAVFTDIYGDEVQEPVQIAHGVLIAIFTFFGLERSVSMALTLFAVSVARYGYRFSLFT